MTDAALRERIAEALREHESKSVFDDADRPGFRIWRLGCACGEWIGDDLGIHFECMGTGSWWMRITTEKGQEFDVNLGVKRVKSAGENRDCVWFDKHLTNWAHHEEDA